MGRTWLLFRKTTPDRMDTLKDLLDLFLHLDKHLNEVIADYGVWTYLLLFVIVFCETGLVVTPILPGDSLLFAVGALAANPESPLNIYLLSGLLWVAAVLGDAVNYAVGNYLGPRVLSRDGRFLKRAYLERTQQFFDRYGGKTIVLARFVPIVRTFAPFLAGVAGMPYRRFLPYNVIGGVAWIASLVYAGYVFGNIPWVKDNLSLIVVGIVVVSLIPAVITFVQERRAKSRS